MGMAKITLSVPDNLYEMIQKYRDVNWSEVFRRAAQAEIKKLERKGELLEGLFDYLSHKLSDVEEARERIRREEIERFIRKWGEPDHTEKTEETPVYISLWKNVMIKIGDKEIGKINISNSRTLSQGLLDRIKRGFGEVDIEALDEKLRPIAEYLNSKGFKLEARHLTQPEVLLYVYKNMLTSEAKNLWRQQVKAGYSWLGLFASDGEDYVFLGYKEVKKT